MACVSELAQCVMNRLLDQLLADTGIRLRRDLDREPRRERLHPLGDRGREREVARVDLVHGRELAPRRRVLQRVPIGLFLREPGALALEAELLLARLAPRGSSSEVP